MGKVSGVISNMGNTERTFYVSASILSNIAGSGCGLSGTALAEFDPKAVTLVPASSESYSFDTEVDTIINGYAPDTPGTYYIMVKVFDGVPALGQCMDGCFISYPVTVVVDATITCA